MTSLRWWIMSYTPELVDIVIRELVDNVVYA